MTTTKTTNEISENLQALVNKYLPESSKAATWRGKARAALAARAARAATPAPAPDNAGWMVRTRAERSGFAVGADFRPACSGRYAIWCRWTDAAAAGRCEAALGKAKQISNFSTESQIFLATPYKKEWSTIHYKGRYSGYTGQHLMRQYQCGIGISRSGRTALVVTEGRISRLLRAPSGTRFAAIEANDYCPSHVAVVRESDGVSCELMAGTVVKRNWIAIIRRMLAREWSNRVARARAARAAQA